MNTIDLPSISDFLTVTSPSIPPSRLVVTKTKNDSYVYSLNCLKISIGGLNYVVSPLLDIQPLLVKQSGLSDGSNPFEVHPDTDFYLGFGSKVEPKYIWKEAKLSQLYYSLTGQAILQAPKGREKLISPDILACFAVFDCPSDTPQNNPQFPDLTSLLKNHNQQPKVLEDELILYSNSFATSFERLFRGVTLKTRVSQISSSSEGVFRLDIRGYPELEGSLVQGQSIPFLGVALPGLFHCGNEREYVSFCADLSLLLPNIFYPIQPAPLSLSYKMQRWLYNRLKSVASYPLQKKNSFEFWSQRTCKINTYNKLTLESSTASGVLLNSNLVMTNRHLTDNVQINGRVYLPGSRLSAEIDSVILLKGSLDLCFLVLKTHIKDNSLKNIPSFYRLFADSYKNGSDTYSFGYPPSNYRKKEAVFTASKGDLLSYWHLRDTTGNMQNYLRQKFAKEPVLLLVSNFIMNGNSGGPVLDAEGRLLGLVFCNMNMGEKGVVNEIAMAVNIGLFRSSLYQVLKTSHSRKWYEQFFAKNRVLNYKNKKIDSASEFYLPDEFLEKL